MILLPTHRPPTSPGRLLQRFLDDYELTQTAVAERTSMQLRRVNEILKKKRAITPDTALRLARLFGTTPDLWINAQTAWDLWHAAQAAGARIEQEVEPLAEAGQERRSAGLGAAVPRVVREGVGGGEYAELKAVSTAPSAPAGVRRSWSLGGSPRHSRGAVARSKLAKASSRTKRMRKAGPARRTRNRR